MILKVKYHYDIPKIEYNSIGDWIDLRAAKNYTLKTGEYGLMSLGISMKLPIGYEAHVAPRGSTFKVWGILQTNGVGVIDWSYQGDNDIWKFSYYATRDTVVNKGDRVCQFRLMLNQPKFDIITVESLENNNRGGFGSTGKN